ncbi:MAG: hypothetical protein ABEJ55_08045 [Halanaeroarchaeum sp.]
MTVTRSFRGISVRLARHYLEGLGGEAVDETTVVADDWEASLSSTTVSIGPSLNLTEVTVTVEGDDGAVEDLMERFAQKAMRAGG